MGRLLEQRAHPEKGMDALEALRGMAGEGKEIVFGAYTGTGGTGVSNAVSITFEKTPSIVLVVGGGFIGYMAYGDTSGACSAGTGTGTYLTLTWTENSLSWYYTSSSGAGYQLNTSGQRYQYMAFIE